MKTSKKALKAFLALTITSSHLALSAPIIHFSFNGFTTESANECKTMGLDLYAKQISVSTDLSAIQDPYTGTPVMAGYTGMSWSSQPPFFFLGIKDHYAYMTEGTTARIKLKTYTGVYFTLSSTEKYTNYRGSMRLNDALGNACFIVLKQD